MKQLIVNADDFGYTRGVNEAIVEAHARGIVTSTSLMANGPAFEDAVERAKDEPGLDIGCHLNFVEGLPVSAPSQIPHLVGANGRFHSAAELAFRLVAGMVPADELERECTAQIEKLLGAGISPSHIDTHKHTHLHPRVASVAAEAAHRFSIGWIRRPFQNFRVPGVRGTAVQRVLGGSFNFLARPFERHVAGEGLCLPDYFTGFELTGKWTRRAIEDTLSDLPHGVTELMCHPGFYDADLAASPTRLKRQRQIEFDIAADESLRVLAESLGVVLRDFRGVPAATLQISRTAMEASSAGRV